MSTVPETPMTQPAYPATLSVDYPDRNLNRLTSFFRIFTVIPILIIVVLLISLNFDSRSAHAGLNWQYTSAGFVFFPLILMILFRKKYPKWWFDWNLALTRFSQRVSAYFLLLRDEYPSTDEEQSVHTTLVYPDAQKDLMRGMPLVKWFLAIPHIFILIFLGVAALVCAIIAWFAILFTAKYPRGLFDFEVGVMRWSFRVEAYFLLLVTDKYPPFSLES